MDESVKSELLLFLVSILTGVATGIIFDFFRAMRKIRNGESKLILFEDVVFWLFETVLIFSVLYNFNSGQIRFYFFIGLASGAALHLLTLSPVVTFVFEKTGVLVKFVVCVVYKLFCRFFGILVKPIVKFSRITIKNMAKTKKRLKMY